MLEPTSPVSSWRFPLRARLPAFLALNEPETSLHPDLLEPLARLIVQGSEDA